MTLFLPSSHLHQPYWLAPCNSELIIAYTLPYINHILGLPVFFLNSSPLKMGQIGCPKTSVWNYHYSLHNNPEECSSHLLCGGSLKSTTNFFYLSPLTSYQLSTPFKKGNLVSDSLTYRGPELQICALESRGK
jgi:hypothetical protein